MGDDTGVRILDKILDTTEESLASDATPDRLAAANRDKLAARFRLSVRQLMNDDEIQKLLKDRVVRELTGKEDMQITQHLVKVAAAQVKGKESHAKRGMQVGSQNINLFVGWTPDELLRYAVTGEIPAHANKSMMK